MAETKIIPVGPDFQMDGLVRKLAQLYTSKGFEVLPTQIGGNVSIKFSKDSEGIKKFVGLAQEVTATLSLSDSRLVIQFGDAEWTGKIIGLAVGWFFCLIPFFIAIYGAVRQSELPKKIANDIRGISGSGPTPFPG